MPILQEVTQSERPRVLVIDGNLLTAEAIVLALGQLDFTSRFVVPVTTEHLRDVVVTWRPRLALLDIDSVAHSTSLECVDIMQGADIPVAVMGGKSDDQLLGRCIHAGASSVVDKNSPLVDLGSVIVRHLAGEVVLREDVRQRLTEPYHREIRDRRARLSPFEVLTPREKCVLGELMEGYAAEAIARRSSVSISTVRSQIKAILQKLGVNSQLAAAAMARQAGWSPGDAGARADVLPS